jgi:hypothetical protein
VIFKKKEEKPYIRPCDQTREYFYNGACDVIHVNAKNAERALLEIWHHFLSAGKWKQADEEWITVASTRERVKVKTVYENVENGRILLTCKTIHE